ncbi:hypothetical protein M422DRAFT_156698 [Sphaerobolus stellatus SS14]|nr:hypothetical protein M422DRAFT_156698 [Sphaerobolus stellatus SS14]
MGRGTTLARLLRMWTWDFLKNNDCLPINRAQGSKSMIEDEDLSAEIQEHLQGLGKKYFSAIDVYRFLAQPETMIRFNLKKAPTERTARRWLKVMEYRYGTGKNGMYIDGHEREDVVEYRNNIFIPLWESIESCMMTWTRDNVQVEPRDSTKPKIVLLTHDESTFYANDRRKTRWIHKDEKPEPARKGEGASIMVSDFCSPDLGWLKSKDGKEEVRIIFKAGKNRDGYFGNEDLVKQTKHAIKLFKDNFGSTAIAAFAFDNATTHQKRADDALSARHMPKFPKHWLGKNGKARMCHGRLPNGQPQTFYFSEDHPTNPGEFKGMEIILQERGLIRESKLRAQCPKFKCADPQAACCCRRVLFNQPDFLDQKPVLVELIESYGYIAFFYPKFHCELNFIEQCWGSGKYLYRMLPLTQNEAQMEQNIRSCLDQVDILKMRRFANRSARFIFAYQKGLNGTQATWVNKKYHGHRTIPESILELLEDM